MRAVRRPVSSVINTIGMMTGQIKQVVRYADPENRTESPDCHVFVRESAE